MKKPVKIVIRHVGNPDYPLDRNVTYKVREFPKDDDIILSAEVDKLTLELVTNSAMYQDEANYGICIDWRDTAVDRITIVYSDGSERTIETRGLVKEITFNFIGDEVSEKQ